MQNSQASLDELFAGLKLLADSAFPKQCSSCGRLFADLAQFVAATTALDSASGLSEVDATLVLARRCSCGATLAEDCDDRRASDPLGLKRRQLFERLLTLLTDSGMPSSIAKRELIRVMRGGKSELFTNEQLAKFFS